MLVVENHELHLLSFEEPFDELESESAESVSMGNGNRAYFSFKRSFQKGFKPFAFEVEPTADVFDDFGFGTLLVEEGDLSFKVCFLAGGRDAAVGDCNPAVVDSGTGVFESVVFLGVVSSCGTLALFGKETLDIVEPGVSRRPYSLYFSLVRPPTQRFYRNPQSLCCHTSLHPGHFLVVLCYHKIFPTELARAGKILLLCGTFKKKVGSS